MMHPINCPAREARVRVRPDLCARRQALLRKSMAKYPGADFSEHPFIRCLTCLDWEEIAQREKSFMLLAEQVFFSPPRPKMMLGIRGMISWLEGEALK